MGNTDETDNVKGLTAAQFKDNVFLATYGFSSDNWIQGVIAPLLKGMPYTISFDANEGEGYMDDQTVTSEDNDALSANTFVRSGYHFTGWNTKADGTGVDIPTDTKAVLVGPEMLYAQWEANTVLVDITLTGHLNGGAYCASYYNQNVRYILPEGAAADTMDKDYHLYRLGVDGRTIPANTAVVIIADRTSISLTPDTGTTTVTDNVPNGSNILLGSNNGVPVANFPDGKSAYVLSVDTSGNLGFRRYTGTADIPAHKAYYVVIE